MDQIALKILLYFIKKIVTGTIWLTAKELATGHLWEWAPCIISTMKQSCFRIILVEISLRLFVN